MKPSLRESYFEKVRVNSVSESRGQQLRLGPGESNLQQLGVGVGESHPQEVGVSLGHGGAQEAGLGLGDGHQSGGDLVSCLPSQPRLTWRTFRIITSEL